MKKKGMIYLQPVILLSKFPKERSAKESYGYNAFACRINGEKFSPSSGGSKKRQVYGVYSNNFSSVRITAKCTQEHPYKYLTIELNNYYGIGEYLLSEESNECTYEEFYHDNTWKSLLTKTGKVIITKDDRLNFVVAGSFEFTAANTANNSDKVIVSNGFFDLQF